MFGSPEAVHSSGSRSPCWALPGGRQLGAARPQKTTRLCPEWEEAAERGRMKCTWQDARRLMETHTRTWAFRPIFSSLRPLWKPFMPFSTRNRLMPCAAVFASRLVTVTTTTRSDIQPFVMNTWRRDRCESMPICDGMTTTSCCFFHLYLVAVEDPVAAVLLGVRPHTLKIAGKEKRLHHQSYALLVAMHVASCLLRLSPDLPAPGSVIAIAPMHVPAVILGMKRSTCSLLP